MGFNSNSPIFLFIAAILAGFALIYVSTLLPTVIVSFAPFLVFVGSVAVIVFSVYILYQALRALF